MPTVGPPKGGEGSGGRKKEQSNPLPLSPQVHDHSVPFVMKGGRRRGKGGGWGEVGRKEEEEEAGH